MIFYASQDDLLGFQPGRLATLHAKRSQAWGITSVRPQVAIDCVGFLAAWNFRGILRSDGLCVVICSDHWVESNIESNST